MKLGLMRRVYDPNLPHYSLLRAYFASRQGWYMPVPQVTGDAGVVSNLADSASGMTLQDAIMAAKEQKKLVAAFEMDVRNAMDINEAIGLFGAVILGVDVPPSAEKSDEWQSIERDVAGRVAVVMYGTDFTSPGNPRYNIRVQGEEKLMTGQFFLQYVNEAYAVLTADHKPPYGVPIDVFEAYGSTIPVPKPHGVSDDS